jgi:hypothetical protein
VSQQLAYAQKRRSTRIDQVIPVVVQGVGALREPYQEQVSTVSISCHGCSYVSKNEVIQGETVYLDIKPANNGSAGCSSRARVKWAQKLGAKDRAFQIAVELETAGNIWGVATPPPDWFPLQIPEAIDPASLPRELKVVPRKEQQAIPAPAAVENRQALPAKVESAGPGYTPIAQLMVGLGEQIQTMAAQAASAAVVKEKAKLIDEFSSQLRDEAVKVIKTAIAASKDVLARQAIRELSEAHEADARNIHALWRKKIEQDLETARQHILNHGKEVSQHLEATAASTVERVQSKMDATRSEAVERFVSRIRDQVAPMLEEAKVSLQKLEGAEATLRRESEAIFAGMENQLAYSTNDILARSQEDLEKNSANIVAKTNEALSNLSQDFERAAQDHANSLLASTGSQLTNTVQEKTAGAFQEFSRGLESLTRNYLDSISKAIANVPQRVAEPSRR